MAKKHRAIALIEGIVHDLRNFGSAGGYTQCDIAFLWRGASEETHARYHANVIERGDDVTRQKGMKVTCVVCLGL